MRSTNHSLVTQAKDIYVKTGKSLEDIADIVKRTGLTQRNEIRSMFLREFGLAFGDANALAEEIVAKWIPQSG
jgi:hypothetical protein